MDRAAGTVIASKYARHMLAVVAALTTIGLPLPAQAADDATRAAARSLGYEGINDFQAGNYAAASEKLDRAYRALRVPSLGLWSARALEKTGKLVAASERYLEIQRLDAGGGDVTVQKQAQADAETEHAALIPRIPSILIQVEGAPHDKVAVTVDGAAIPGSLLGIKRSVDPGIVKVVGQHAGAAVTEKVSLEEGDTKTVTLRFSAARVAMAPVASGSAATPASPSADAPTDQGAEPSAGSGRRTIGWIALGAGGAGLLTGAVTGGLAMSTRSSIAGCEDTRCPPRAADDVDAYNRFRMISSIGFIAGGALAATGAVLILTAPRGSSSPTTADAKATYRFSPWVSAGSAGLALEVER